MISKMISTPLNDGGHAPIFRQEQQGTKGGHLDRSIPKLFPNRDSAPW